MHPFTLGFKKNDLPSPFTVNILFQDGSHRRGILLPHELFAALYQHPAFWKVAMVPDDAKLPELWTAIQGWVENPWGAHGASW